MDFRQCAIKGIVEESADVRTFEIAPLSGEPPAFEPGQFFLLRLPDESGKKIFRPYSAASAKGEAALKFCIKRNGAFTSLLWKLSPEDGIEVGGPYGTFVLGKDDSCRVLVAGGTGIAPMRSMAHETIREGKKCLLFHSARNIGELTYFDEMKALASKGNGFAYYPSITRDAPSGWKGLNERITAKTISLRMGQLDGNSFYLCGPKEMVASVAESLLLAGVPKERIKREEWG